MTTMVQISYGHDDTFIELSRQEMDEDQYCRSGSSNGNCSFMSNCRDSSNCHYEMSEELRQSVNTHNSILNVTSDDEEDEDEEDNNPIFNFAYEDESHRAKQLSCCSTPASQAWSSSLANVTESLVDVFCVSDTCLYSIHTTHFSMHHGDVINVLGCGDDPTAEELQAWSLLQIPRQVQCQKRSMKSRAAAMSRVRQERAGQTDLSGICRIRSMDDSLLTLSEEAASYSMNFFGDEDLDQLIGKGMDAIAIEDGYDSDPEILDLSAYSSKSDVPSILSAPVQVPSNDDDDELLSETVEHTLNYTWSLMCHTEHNSTPVEVWMERGYILNEGMVIIEPKIMWREVFQGELELKRLSESSQCPWSIRMLNACRIVPTFDKAKYPLAHSQRSFLLKTVSNESYLFEASSTSERDAIITRWKIVIARLATLAVMEDMATMAVEFFANNA